MVLKSCCFRFSLRIGSLTIALIILLFQFILCIDAAIALGKDTYPLLLKIVTLISDQYIDELLEATLLSMLVTGTALYGIIKAKPKKIVKFLMLLVLYLVAIAGTIVYLIIEPMEILKFLGLDEKFQLQLICGLISLFGLQLYFLLVVHSYYRELKYVHLEHIVATVESCVMTSFK